MLRCRIVDHGEAQVCDVLVSRVECIPHCHAEDPSVERCKRKVLPLVERYQLRLAAITHVHKGKPARLVKLKDHAVNRLCQDRRVVSCVRVHG